MFTSTENKMIETKPYAHRPHFCPHCAMLDTQQDPESIISRVELPITFADQRSNDIYAFDLTIKCPFCKKCYKATENHVARHFEGTLSNEEISRAKERIEELDAEIFDLQQEREEHQAIVDDYY